MNNKDSAISLKNKESRLLVRLAELRRRLRSGGVDMKRLSETSKINYEKIVRLFYFPTETDIKNIEKSLDKILLLEGDEETKERLEFELAVIKESPNGREQRIEELEGLLKGVRA
jgi:hypothetical protein